MLAHRDGQANHGRPYQTWALSNRHNSRQFPSTLADHVLEPLVDLEWCKFSTDANFKCRIVGLSSVDVVDG